MKLIKNATAEKLRGGFYTPEPIAAFILKWGINGSSDYEILEPSCGDGVFIQAVANNDASKQLKMTCFEILDTEVEKSRELAKQLGYVNCEVNAGDFLVWANKLLLENNPVFYCFVDCNKKKRK